MLSLQILGAGFHHLSLLCLALLVLLSASQHFQVSGFLSELFLSQGSQASRVLLEKLLLLNQFLLLWCDLAAASRLEGLAASVTYTVKSRVCGSD